MVFNEGTKGQEWFQSLAALISGICEILLDHGKSRPMAVIYVGDAVGFVLTVLQ